ncbi:MAG: putative 2-nitropropane dioxygenase [Nocardia sp.]|uniref:NAD(P)H-dependent flavin oxidoreductase n=1 Tax=Nocardia sp. TaxID=1821 RepID=UPI0026019E89|nr:nitronate monooxygenase family protein [Nocardia sp.]MCU1642695.1 putative 2-nitropropane dioxygenase [Nocardia sp.]
MSLPPILSERLRLPAVASPMFLVSGPELVIAQSRAGVVGSFPSLNARPQSQFREWLVRINEELAKHDAENPDQPSAPYAVNLIVHKSNDRLEEDLATVVEFQVPIVITSLGARADVNEAVHSYGGIVLHDVINNVFAHKAVERGADGLIAVAAGAGGHAGAQSPFALIQEIRAWFDGPLLLSGAIGHGRSVLAAQAAGADLAYIGSAFIATEEANATTDYKQMIVDSTAADIIYSSRFTGVHGNYLRPSIKAVGLDPDDLGDRDPSAMDFGTDESQTAEAKPWRDIWGSGQGIATVTAVTTTAEVVDRLATEYTAAKVRLQQL